MKRNSESSPFHEYLQRTQEIALNLLLSNEKKRKISPINGKQGEFKETDQEIFAGQQRALIIQLLKDIVLLCNNDLIDNFKPMLYETLGELREITGTDHRGLLEILKLLGMEKIEKYEHPRKEIELNSNNSF